MKKIILHLGPPKTGTSTIQNILRKQDLNNYISQDSILGEKIISVVRGNLTYSLLEIREEIQNMLTVNNFLIYSDERVLFEYTIKSDWRSQLKKLFEIFQFTNTELELVLCLRNPKDALPSLYQQMKTIGWVSTLSFNNFLATNQANVFDYDFLEKELIKIGFKNISYYNFKVLLQKELNLSLFGLNTTIALNEAKNKSKTINGKRINNYTATDYLRRNFKFLRVLIPVKYKLFIAKILNFKLKNEVIITDTSLIQNRFLESYYSRK